MLSTRQLANFSAYLAACPKKYLGVPRPVLGAYDAVGGAAAHGFRRGLDMRDFGRGGAFDSIGGKADRQSVETALKFLAEKLSSADWAALQDHLCGADPDEPEEAEESEEAMDREEPLGIPRRDKDGFPKNALAEDSRRYSERFPGAARITSGGHSAPARARAKAPTTAAAQSYADRFPSASRIGRG